MIGIKDNTKPPSIVAPKSQIQQTQQTYLELEKFVRLTSSDMVSTVRQNCAKLLDDVQDLIENRKFHVIFEPRLGVPTADAQGPRSILPVFRADIYRLIKEQEGAIIERIDPALKTLVTRRDASMIGNMEQQASRSKNSSEEVKQLTFQVDLLQKALSEMRQQKTEQVDKYRKEVNMLREQLTQKGKVGSVYKPDFMQNAGNDDSVVTMKYMNDQLTQQHNQHMDDLKLMEKKYKQQQTKTLTQLSAQEQETMRLKDELDQLYKIVDQKNQDYEDLKNFQQQLLDQTKNSLQQEINDLIAQNTRAEVLQAEELNAQSQKIARMQQRLTELTQENLNLTQENQQLKDELFSMQLKLDQNSNQLSLLTVQSKTDTESVKKIEQLQKELFELQKKNHVLSEQLYLLKEAKDLLEKDQKKPQFDTTSENELAQLLMQAKNEFVQVKKLFKNCIKSLFDDQSGTLTHLALNKLHVNIYQQFTADIKEEQKVATEYFKNELNMLQIWASKYPKIGFNSQSSQKSTELHNKDEFDEDKPMVDVKKIQEEPKKFERVPSGRNAQFQSARPRTAVMADEDDEDVEYLVKDDNQDQHQSSIAQPWSELNLSKTDTQTQQKVNNTLASVQNLNRPLSQQMYQSPPRPRQVKSAKPLTQSEMTGVFDRLQQEALNIQMRSKRKRELIIQERMRTQERVLRALSLFVENKPRSPSVFDQQPKPLMVISPDRINTARNSAQRGQSVQGDVMKAVMQIRGRPQSAQGIKVPPMKETKRPMSGKQDAVMQLLAAGGILAKTQKK
uniref:Uncharacterized protein n=1 Tax=Trepomonas sp. PC1 TaxID=1076344 RepID=A0A146KNB3_9EUKA|eukprot:JAP96539.1 Hypothetical protein TPC1_10094 [Trepomonas sp. PC1]